MNDFYTLPDSFVLFLAAAVLVFPGQVLYRRKTGGKEPDNHMRFIWAGALPPLAYELFFTKDLYRMALNFLPLWLAYWTFYDIAYHAILHAPLRHRKFIAAAVYAVLWLLFGFGLSERFGR